MSRKRIAELAQGLASLITLLALVIVPPVALVRFVGWPLPTTIPSFDEIEQSVRLGIDDMVVVKSLAVLAWLAWAQVALSVVWETAAAIRGRTPRRGSVVPGLQAVVGRLVASATLVATSINAAHVPVAGAAPAPVASVVRLVPTLPADLDAAPTGGSVDPAPAISFSAVTSAPTRHDDPQTIEVRRHDSWWAIAERTLGNGLRWQEIRQANIGRTMPDGHTITSDTHQTQPGWLLRLPADAAVAEGTDDLPAPTAATVATEQAQPSPAEQPEPVQQAATPVATGDVTVVHGDSMWRIAERCLADALGRPPSTPEIAIYWSDFVEANRDRFIDAGNPDLIHPGQTFVLPTMPAVLVSPGSDATPSDETSGPAGSPTPQSTDSPAPRSEAPTESPVPRSPDATTGADGGRAQPVPTSVPSDGDGTQPSPTTTRAPETTSTAGASRGDEPGARDTDGSASMAPLLMGAGVTGTALAVGVTRAIRRRRRRRNHQAPTTAPVVGGNEDLHRQLLLDADEDRTEALSRALDDLAVRLAEAGHACRPRIVQHGAEHVDVLLDQATLPAVRGWEAQAEGAVWSVSPTQVPSHVERVPVMPAPLLVTIGEPDDGGQLHLDLEAVRLVTLTGNFDLAYDLASTMVAELAHSPFTDNAQIIVVDDFQYSRLADLDRVTAVDGWKDVADNLAAWTEQSRQALTANDWPNSFVARGHDPDHDALIPLVVFAPESPDDSDLLDLVLAGPASTAVVIVGEVVPNATIVDCQPGRLSLPQLGLTCRPQVLSSDDVDGVAELLDIAGDTSGEQLVFALDHPPTPNGSDGAAGTHEPHEDPPHEVLVRFLGEISVEGGQSPPTAKQTALIAYIALHRSVSADRAAEAVWVTPSAVSPRKRLGNLLTKCRGAVGTRHLPAINDNHYTIGPDVATDVDLFERRVKAAAGMAPEQAVETLRGALDLVRGPIFGYPDTERDSYTWVALGDWISHWELHITKAAQRATELYLDLGEPAEAVEISGRMHRIVPTDSGLTEALMRAHAAAGNRHALLRVYQAHITALEQLGLDTVADSTAELYEQLQVG